MSSQGAGNNGGQAAGRQFVSFTRPAAQRIAKVVRTVEAGNRTQPGVEFDHPMPAASFKVIRRATFSGSWPLGESTAVTLVQSPTATVSATNLTWPTNQCTSSSTTCIVGKEGTNWWLLTRQSYDCDCDEPLTKAKLSAVENYDQTVPQVLGHDAGSGDSCVQLKWLNVIDCDPDAE